MIHLRVSDNRIEGVFEQQLYVYFGDCAGYKDLELREVEAQNINGLTLSFCVWKAG